MTGAQDRSATFAAPGLRRAVVAAFLLVVLAAAALATPPSVPVDFAARFQPPMWQHPFGTDSLGRDMLTRCLAGLGLSLRIGLIAAALSAAVALALAMAASLSGLAGRLVSFLTDAVLSLPHLVLLILLSFAFGGGADAVVAAIALSHWPRLTRLLRLEIAQVLASDYVATARAFGRSRLQVAVTHLTPHLLPQLGVGTLLLMPHAVLHEAGMTFLGFGLEPTRPAIGILLAEAMQSISAGHWWLGVFPGLVLVLAVALIARIGAAFGRLAGNRHAGHAA